ncbi:MAG: hypothetical protein QXI59_07430, partial [Candidatus Bathyarchaeia archaeon]
QQAGDLLKDAIFEACGWPTAKEIILKEIVEGGEVAVDRVGEEVVGKPGDWANTDKVCEANRTFRLYVEELIKEGRIIKVDGRLKPAPSRF